MATVAMPQSTPRCTVPAAAIALGNLLGSSRPFMVEGMPEPAPSFQGPRCNNSRTGITTIGIRAIKTPTRVQGRSLRVGSRRYS